jgi:hypothetical protein
MKVDVLRRPTMESIYLPWSRRLAALEEAQASEEEPLPRKETAADV